MDFGVEGLDLDDLILSERNKLWIDKKKLSAGMSTDNVSSDVSYSPIVKQFDPNCNQVPGVEDSAYLGKDQRRNYRPTPKEISSPAFSSEPRMRATVRHGEYSPLHPNFLSPGKFMLGLGEYEERRRLLMLQKKQEYKEYLSQVRLLVHSRNGNPSPTHTDRSETNLKPHSPYNEDQYLELSNNNKHIQSSYDLPNTLYHQQVLDAVITTPTHSSIGVQTLSPSMGGFLDEPASPKRSQYAGADAENLRTPDGISLTLNQARSNLRTPDGISLTLNQARSNLRTPDYNSLTLNQGGTLNSQPVSAENLSPRERKLADLQVSQQLSKMFFETSQETNPTQIPTTNFQARRHSHSEIYKEELRQQIEAKRKLDNELREKEKREEEAINRRVEAQQEKIRLEYLKEEAKRLEMQKQRLTELEEFPDRQLKCTRSSHEIALPRPITSNEEVYSPEQIVQGQTILSETSAPQLKQDLRKSINPVENPPLTVRTEQKVNCSVQIPPALPFRSKSFTVIDSTISDDASFIKPPVDAESNRLWKPTDRNMQMKGCKTCNFEDSLPIPLFRSKSPANLPVDVSGTETIAKNRMSSNNKNSNNNNNNNIKPTTSQAMKKLEAKWQVPAVEKNNITRTVHQGPGGGRQKNVLTQLGAFRQQLQLEQMQTEGYKTVKPHRTKMK